MFPRLHHIIEAGLGQINIAGKTTPSNDWLSTTPSAVFLNIAKYLSLEELQIFSTLNKHLHHRCLISESFQNIVRPRLDINAIPILDEYPPISEEFPIPLQPETGFSTANTSKPIPPCATVAESSKSSPNSNLSSPKKLRKCAISPVRTLKGCSLTFAFWSNNFSYAKSVICLTLNCFSRL